MELEVGSILEGKVTSITKFGAFVALPGGKSGLVHISEIAHSYVNDVNDFLKEGQTVKVKVINIDDRHRINLSIKQTLPPPARENHRSSGGSHYSRSQQGHSNGNNGNGGHYSGSRNSSSRSRSYVSAPPVQAKGPDSFEDQLKKFMQESDSRQADLYRGTERRSRRSNGRNRNNNNYNDDDYE